MTDKARVEGRKIALFNGIPARTFDYRIQCGWTIEQASTLPAYTRINKWGTNPHKRKDNYRYEDEVITFRTKNKVWVD